MKNKTKKFQKACKEGIDLILRAQRVPKQASHRGWLAVYARCNGLGFVRVRLAGHGAALG